MTAGAELMTLARAVAALVAVVVLALLAARLLRRVGHRPARSGLRVVDRIALTREASVSVVEVGGRRLVLGVTAREVRVLADLDAAAATAADAEAAEAGPAEAPAAGEAPAVRSEPADAWPPAQLPAGVQPGRPVRGPDGVTVTWLPEGSAAVLHRLDPGRATSSRRGTASRGGTGSVLDPRTWRQGIEALRDLTARRG